MNTQTIFIVIVVGVVALLTFCIIGIYNKIINSKNIVNDKWDEVNRLISDKVKLVSKLVEIIRGISDDSDINKLLEVKNKLDNSISINDRIDNNNRVDKIIEIFDKKYKNNNSYNEIIKSLELLNNKIDYSMEFYNEFAFKYNLLIVKFPYKLVAILFKFRIYPLEQ